MHCRDRAAAPQRRVSLLVLVAALARLLRPTDATANATNASTPVPSPPPPAAVTACPAASSANLTCYVGAFPFHADVLAYTSGGGCTCNCSANAATATSDYAPEPFLPPATTGLAVTYAAYPAVCGSALCQSAFPTKCGRAAYVNSTFTPLGSWLTANASATTTYAYPAPVVAAPGSVCVAYIATCTVLRSTDLCPLGVTTNNMTVYSAVSAAGCTTLLSQATRFAPYLTVVQACSSSGCNVPQAPPPPSPRPPPPAPTMPSPMPVAASGGVWASSPHKHGAITLLLAAAAALL